MRKGRRFLRVEQTLWPVRERLGISEAAMDEALQALSVHEDLVADEVLHLPSLAAYVEKLGGTLEVHAVFPEETVVVWQDGAPVFPPDDAEPADAERLR